MSKLIRHAQKRGTVLFVALQLTALTFLSLLSFIGGPQQAPKAPAETQVSAPAQAETDPSQTQTAQPTTAADLTAAQREALRASAHPAKKLYEPLNTQVFTLQRSRVESQAAQRSAQGPEALDNEPTLTTDRQDYPPYSYVYFTGSGFQPGETVNMIVVETDPIQQSFEPWDVVADENGNFQTSWYVFSPDFIGATFQATATGQSSQLTASATFTDATYLTYENAGHTILRDAFAWEGGTTVYYFANGIATKCHRVDWVYVPSNTVVPSTIFAASNPLSDSFVIPASSSSSGVWQVKIYESTANTLCATAIYPTTPIDTETFDVARTVVIGAAPSPVPLGGGGDSSVREDDTSGNGVQSPTASIMDVRPDSAKRRRSFLQFVLPSLSGNTVTSAKLRLLPTTVQNSRTHNVYRVTASWSESTITFNNEPGVAGGVTDAQSVPA